jgi:hypothetical protein
MYCSGCGKESPPTVSRCHHCGKQLKSTTSPWMNRILLGIAALAVLAIAGRWAYSSYTLSLLKQQLAVAVGKDSGYTETVLKIEKDSPNMTFAELFQLCDKAIEGRDVLIVELRGLYPDIPYDLKDKLIDFLNSENELTREKRAFYRAQMEFSTSVNILTKHLADRPDSVYAIDFWVKRTKQLRGEAKEHAEAVVKSCDAFSATYSSIDEKETLLGKQMDAEGVRFVRVFQKYKDSNATRVDGARRAAQTASSQLAS